MKQRKQPGSSQPKQPPRAIDPRALDAVAGGEPQPEPWRHIKAINPIDP